MLIIHKGTQECFRLSDTGEPTFTPLHREYQASGVASGELRIRAASTTCLDSVFDDGTHVIRLAGRLHEQAVLPNVGLQLKRGSTPQAELHSNGNLYVRGDLAGTLPNPGQAGAQTWTSVVYAAPGMNYASMVAPAEYAIFHSPTANYQTRTIDISDFLSDLPITYNWPFNSTAVPINGLIRIPNGSGPFPLAVFVHGNHSASENSTSGYVYLLELLASHGIIAASIDCNFLNGSVRGENDARAIVHLEHIRQFQIWNTQIGHPLHEKADLSRIMIIGHSRGGEGVGHASLFNSITSVQPDLGGPSVALDGSAGLGPYGFPLLAVAAIAPTDSQYTPVSGATKVKDNYFVIHGSRDGDVWPFNGYRTYDRAHPINLSNPTQDAEGSKSLLWLIGGNHNYFNSVWSGEGSPTVTRAEQETVARVYLGAIAKANLLNQPTYLKLLRDHRLAWTNTWISNNIKLTSQYQDPRRTFIDHYEQNTPNHPSLPVVGTISSAGLTVTEMSLHGSAYDNTYQETKATKLAWTSAGGYYKIQVASGLVTGTHQYLVMRCGQTDDDQNTPDKNQNFAISLSDGTHFHTVLAGDYGELPYPSQLNNSVKRSVMQTLRIPLKTFNDAGVNIMGIVEVKMAFDEPQIGTTTVKGSLYIDEIQISE